MDTIEKLKAQVREAPLLARLEYSRVMIAKMCKEGRPPRMSIPMQPTDEDFFISVTLEDAIAELQKVNSL